MTWRDRLEKGSYRGVPFGWQRNQLTFGRRTVTYEIPGSELGVGWQDNGRRAWRQAMTVIVIGPNYDIARNAMIEAFDKKGPAKLVHPFYGTRNVVIEGPVTLTETQDLGGMASFTFTAVEVAEQDTPTTSVSTGADLLSAADNAATTLGDALASGHSLKGENFLRVDALQKLDDALASVRKASAVARTIVDTPSRLADAVDKLATEAVYLINSPRRLADSIVAMGKGIKEDLQRIAGAFGSYSRSARSARDVGSDIVPNSADADTPTRAQAQTNALLTKHATRGVMLANVAAASVGLPFETAEEATTARDELVEGIGDLIEDLESGGQEMDPAVFDTLRTLRAATHAHLTAVAGTSLTLSTYETAEPLPSVVIAHVLYGDATRAEEIEQRNSGVISHPGFAYGTLEVLSE